MGKGWMFLAKEKSDDSKKDTRQAEPDDLKYVGVQDSGQAKKAADLIKDRKKQLDEAAKD